MKSISVQKEYIGLSQLLINKNINLKKIGIPFLTALIFLLVLAFASKGFVDNDSSKDMLVADFRTDINKLWEVSQIIEAKRINNSSLDLYEFGSTGELLNTDDLNPNLKQVLIKIADQDGDNKLSENELKMLGVKCLSEEIYSKELKSLRYQSLSVDNNVKHYVIITKGKFVGTVLYNGPLKFIDSSKRYYFGVELFEQL